MQSWASILQYLLFRSSGGSRGAYKDVDEVIEAAEMAGISQRVARLRSATLRMMGEMEYEHR